MKSSSHRSSHAAVLGLKLGQRLQGRLITDDARDLTAAGEVGRLSLGGSLGLWCGHSDARGQIIAEGLGRDLVAHQFGMLGGKIGPSVTVFADESHRRAKGYGVASAKVVGREVGSGEHHVVSPVGPIPTMWISSHVTSDNATTVRREIAA